MKACYDKSLELAYEHKCKSIAFPLLATGTYGFPQKLGIEIAVDSFTRFLTEHEMEIFLVVFGQKSVRISGELGEEVRSYIDDDYVTETLDEEYRLERPRDRRRENYKEFESEDIGSAPKEDEIYGAPMMSSLSVAGAAPSKKGLFASPKSVMNSRLKSLNQSMESMQ